MKIKYLRLMFPLVLLTSVITGKIAIAQKSSGGSDLSGTSWQLVKVNTADESTVVPDDKSKYTFGKDGRVTA